MTEIPQMSETRQNFKQILNQNIKLIGVIGSPLLSKTKSNDCVEESSDLYHLAKKNKISLLYLESLNKHKKLNILKKNYEEESGKYLNFLNKVCEAARILESAKIEYIIFKTIRPYHATPGDIDILIMGNDVIYEKANKIFLEHGYKKADIQEGLSPTLPDLIDPDGRTSLDIQKELELNYVIYLDKSKFKGHLKKKRINSGIEIKTIDSMLDLAITITHSLTESLYLLGEFYTFLYMLSNMSKKDLDLFIEILLENNIMFAAKSFITITAFLHKTAFGFIPDKLNYLIGKMGYNKSDTKRLQKTDFKLPYRYNNRTLLKVVLEKFKEECFRKTAGIQILKMINPKLSLFVTRDLIERQKREYYLKL